MTYTKFFKDISKKDVAIAGGKGASLGEMTNAGIPVPPGFIVTSETFQKFLADTDISVEIDAVFNKVNHKEMESVERASEMIQALIMRADMPADIAKEIKISFKKLGAKFVAVRSSATAEDSVSDAWAGQLDTFLNTTEKDLLEKVQKCWASLFTPRAIFYRFEKKLHKKLISVAVVIQKMVVSEVSGIAFSVHPVTEDRNQIIIESSYGLGEAIVSGQITPDSFVLEKEPLAIIDTNIADKERGLYKNPKSAKPAKSGEKNYEANVWKQIPKKLVTAQSLPTKDILKFAELIKKIEKHYGFPCDIEWAYEKKKFYITQSRPITTLKGR